MSSRIGETAVVIRCWNNPRIAVTVKTYLAMGVASVVVVVNAKPDRGSTHAWLEHIRDPRLHVIDMVDGYTWVNALNRAIMAIHMMNLREHRVKYVMNASVEAVFTAAPVSKMLEAFNAEDVGIVGTTFRPHGTGAPDSLGLSYRHPRNTGMIIRMSALAATHGAFDAWCDGIGGMEDIHFTIAMRTLTRMRPVILDLEVSLLVGVNYNQAEKERREQLAMEKIVCYWHQLFAPGTDERARIDGVTKQMGLCS